MDFMSHYVIVESPNFMNLGLSPNHTTDKLKSVIGPATSIEWLKNISNCLASRHGIKKVTVGRVSEAKSYSDYTKILSLKLPNFLSGKIFL